MHSRSMPDSVRVRYNLEYFRSSQISRTRPYRGGYKLWGGLNLGVFTVGVLAGQSVECSAEPQSRYVRARLLHQPSGGIPYGGAVFH